MGLGYLQLCSNLIEMRKICLFYTTFSLRPYTLRRPGHYDTVEIFYLKMGQIRIFETEYRNRNT